LFFGKFDEETPVKVIHEDPTRNCNQHNFRSFHKHVKTSKARIETFRRLGTGLDNDAFAKLVDLNRPPAPEDQGVARSESESDEDWNDEKENEDEENTLDADTVADLHGPIEDVAVPSPDCLGQSKKRKLPKH
jgi:hypothetical protein